VPGVEKKDLDVSLTDAQVTIKGETTREEKEEKGDYYRCELAHGSFARTIPLPSEVDSETVKATFKDGMLELVMTKSEKSKRRTIKLD
jgi:HSP20 family protein